MRTHAVPPETHAALRERRGPCDVGQEQENRPMNESELRERTKKTARQLFHSLKGGTGFDLWKKFDKDLARELSMFFTGKLYSREVISQKQRELCAVAALTVLHRPNEVRAHLHAALNVGATRQEVAEVIFQMVTYGGMPVVVDALEVFKAVLEERGEWEA
jgi:4-carboxymuconolactone decarboxylase